MPTGVTQISDVIVPEIFTPYMMQQTEEKSRLIQSGVVARSAVLDEKLSGGGLTFNMPSFKPLDRDDDDRVANDTPSGLQEGAGAVVVGDGTGVLDPAPSKIETAQEIAVRMNRNNSWSSMDLATALAGADPMEAIAGEVADYWVKRQQRIFIATMNGISKDNAAAPSGTDTHSAGDLNNDIAAVAFADGVTNFTAEAFLDAAVTMGDSMEDLTAVMVHSIVYNRMQKNNLIDFIPDARGETDIPVFQGRAVIVDDAMPSGTGVVRGDGSAGDSGVFETWLLGAGFMQLGFGSPKVPTEVQRQAGAGNGSGQDILYSRLELSMHPTGHAYIGTAPNGGPSNAASANNLNDAGSWSRVYPERKQIKFARLITREF